MEPSHRRWMVVVIPALAATLAGGWADTGPDSPTLKNAPATQLPTIGVLKSSAKTSPPAQTVVHIPRATGRHQHRTSAARRTSIASAPLESVPLPSNVGKLDTTNSKASASPTISRPIAKSAPSAATNLPPAWSNPTPDSKPEETQATTKAPSPRPWIALEQIPRDEAGRRQMASDLLERGRQMAEAGQFDEAELLLFQVRELAVNYRRRQYSPELLSRDIARARESIRQTSIATAPTTSAVR